jgi:arginine/lysine/ornithine decarboxylase
MGYQPGNRQTTPDFLIIITNPKTRIVREGYENRVPKIPDEFTDHYRGSNVWRINQEDMDAYLRDSVGKPKRASAHMESEHAMTSNWENAYVISIPM